MASESTHTYDLMLLLGADLPEERRDEILAAVDSTVEGGGGTIVSRHDWGVRNLAYEIRHTADAEYRLVQFTGPREMLETLDHNLKITDGVMRFRIIRLHPGTPPPPEATPAAVAPGEAE